jgi:hypothetical protein
MGNSFITFIYILKQRLKRGFEKCISLLKFDRPTQTCILIFKITIFKIGNSFKKQGGLKDVPEANIPLGLFANSLPSTFMHCFGCTALLKKAGLASELPYSCHKNAQKNMRT